MDFYTIALAVFILAVMLVIVVALVWGSKRASRSSSGFRSTTSGDTGYVPFAYWSAGNDSGYSSGGYDGGSCGSSGGDSGGGSCGGGD